MVHTVNVSLQERLEAIKREQEEEAERECTFQPAINGRSARLMAERSEVLKVQIPLMVCLMSSGCALLLPTNAHLMLGSVSPDDILYPAPAVV